MTFEKCYFLWRRGVTCHVLDVSHETPDVTPCRTSPPMPYFIHVSRETPDVTSCHSSPPRGVVGVGVAIFVLMRVAGLARFQKLWGKVDEPLKAGTRLRVHVQDLSFAVNDERYGIQEALDKAPCYSNTLPLFINCTMYDSHFSGASARIAGSDQRGSPRAGTASDGGCNVHTISSPTCMEKACKNRL